MRSAFFVPSYVRWLTVVITFFMASVAEAAVPGVRLDLTAHWGGYAALAIFAAAYVLVMIEDFTHLRKSKPVILAAGIIWCLIAVIYHFDGNPALVEAAVRHDLLNFTELFLFLLVAMTYINALGERRVFDALRSWLIRRQLTYRQLFWATGVLAFFISPVADNLTTALLLCAVILAVGRDDARFISLACINVVVAANAGGAFSPFGDITTLMVWQSGVIEFWTFFQLFLPSVVNFVVPALLMQLAVPQGVPEESTENVGMKRGAKRIMALFGCTIFTAVTFHHFLHLPPVLGMMTGLAYLQFFGYYLKRTHKPGTANGTDEEDLGAPVPFDIFSSVARSEWDTLLFFYGVVLCVGGLGFIGYLAMASELMYGGLGATTANVLVGILSAVVDNIPVMFAVLSMQPDMSQGQWLLVTMTAGVGGSLLSIGSAAGVALMGMARGHYTFLSHLKWAPVIALGYAASVGVHLWLNAGSFVANAG